MTFNGLIPNSYDRINYAVALSVKNNTNPTKNTYASFLRAIYRSKFQTSKRVEKQEIDIIVSAWYSNRWRNLIEESPYFTREETDEWKKEHST